MKSNHILMMILTMGLLLFAIGCDEDDNDNPIQPLPVELSLDDLDAEMITEIVEDGMIRGLELAYCAATAGTQTLDRSLPVPLFIDYDEGGISVEPLIETAPESWSDDDEDGWYEYSPESNYGELQFKANPDPWAAEYNGEPLTGFRYRLSADYSDDEGDLSMTAVMDVITDEGRNHSEGMLVCHFTYTMTSVQDEPSLSFVWELSWEEVPLDAEVTSGQFHADLSWPAYLEDEGVVEVETLTEMNLDADGTGTGAGSMLGEDYLQISATEFDDGQLLGSYSTAEDDWETDVVLVHDVTVEELAIITDPRGLSEAQLQSLVEDGMILQTETGIQQAASMKSVFNDGLFTVPADNHPIYGFKQDFEIADPPDGFTGPDEDGWYTAEDYYYFDEYMVRLTPDLWDNEHAGEDLTKIEFRMHTTYSDYALIEVFYESWAEVNPERTMFDGAWSYSYEYLLDPEGQEVEYNYSYNVSWNDVSLVEGDYSGHYESELYYPIFGQDAVPELISVESVFDLSPDGTGTGTGDIVGQEYVRFTVVSMNYYGEMSGYYTLKSEDWEIEHAF
ncbi:hypothetical protein KQI52_08785 [bacterium]|nr:hypothetical protein [bacterium]